MNFLFGPVHSRRLGSSLGIDLFPHKICNLNCIYCEVGPTVHAVCQRAAYSSLQAIFDEMDVFCADPTRLQAVDVCTVTAKGEPTLHSGLGEILRHLKGRYAKPVAVLTNGTTLMDADVRRDLMAADIVMPSLDAVRAVSFFAIDRPIAGFDVDALVEGLLRFSWEYTGMIWLEILLAQGVNDAPDDIAALITALRQMRLDRIQLNTVLRPPVEPFAHALSQDALTAIATRMHSELGCPVDVPCVSVIATKTTPNQSLATAPLPDPASVAEIMGEIIQMVRRRPSTAGDIERIFHLGNPEKVTQLLAPLVRSGILQQREHGGSLYYQQAV
jgi:wyosine [tRNA(Phe)-imidazoG37] synthetase (radical SAM superfamily)